MLAQNGYADMAELVDAYGSGPYEGDFMEVRVLLSAPRRLPLQRGVAKILIRAKLAVDIAIVVLQHCESQN